MTQQFMSDEILFWLSTLGVLTTANHYILPTLLNFF